MDSLISRLITDLKWIEKDSVGQGAISSAGGRRRAVTLRTLEDPTGKVPGGCQRVQVEEQDGRSYQMWSWPSPLDPAVELGVEVGLLERVVAPGIETIVNQIAHDVRNYAFTIGLQVELGMRRATELPEIKGHLDAVVRQLDALKRYVDRLLLFGRVPALSPTPVDLLRFVREQIQHFRLATGGEGAQAAIAVDETSVPMALRCDAVALGHAMQALLDNAVHSADPPPPVRVRVARAERTAVIEIADRGPGIPPEVMAGLAMPMNARRAGSAGLGLAIARKMVQAHGGSLEIASSAAGTTVRIELPAEAPTV